MSKGKISLVIHVLEKQVICVCLVTGAVLIEIYLNSVQK